MLIIGKLPAGADLSNKSLAAMLRDVLATSEAPKDVKEAGSLKWLVDSLFPLCNDPSCEACNKARDGKQSAPEQAATAPAEEPEVIDAGAMEIPSDVAELVGLNPDSKGEDLQLKLYAAGFLTALKAREAKAQTSDEAARLKFAVHLAQEAAKAAV